MAPKSKIKFGNILLIFVALALVMVLLSGEGTRIPRSATQDYNGTLRFTKGETIIVGCNNAFLASWQTKINSEGYRDEEIKPGPKIGMFGDSFVFGNCLRDEDRIDVLLEEELRKEGSDYNVYNYGIPGFNLNSSLLALDYASRNSKLDYAIVRFSALDDMVRCDVSCKAGLDKTGLAAVLGGADEVGYITKEHNLSKIRLKEDFSRIIEEMLVESGTLNRTRVIFYLFNADEESKSIILPILSEHGIEYIEPDFGGKCDTIFKPCVVPFDGHPSRRFNELAAAQLAGYIAALGIPLK